MEEHHSFPSLTKGNPIVFFDMDGVLTKEKSSWNYVHKRLGVDNSRNYELFKMDKINYQEFLRRDVAIWIEKFGEVQVETIKEILNEIEVFNGAKEATEELVKENFKLIIVSGGIMWLAERVGMETGIDEIYANSIFSLGGKLIPEGRTMVDPKRKDVVIRKLISQYNPQFTISVGDSSSDRSMFLCTDFSISFNYEEVNGGLTTFDLRTEDMRDCSSLILSIRDERNEKL